MLEAAGGILILAGAFFMLVSALGVLRLPDLFMRMHAATKAGTLGAALILFAASLLFGELAVTIKAVFVFLFLLLTAPVAAHVLGRAAYYAGIDLWHRTMHDDLAGKYDRATRRHDGPDPTGSGAAGSPAPDDG
jgi:multicomponent Na+:H+ antiporter subunit G